MGVAELMKTPCPQWALVQQVTVLVTGTVQHLMNNNAHSLVREFFNGTPFRGMAVTCRVIIAFSKSHNLYERNYSFDPGSQGYAAQEPIK